MQDGFETDANKKAASKEVGEEKRKEKEAIRLELEAKLEKKKAEEEKKEEILKAKAEKLEFKTVGKIDIDSAGKKPKEIQQTEEQSKVVEEPITEVSKKEVTKAVEKQVVEPTKEIEKVAATQETKKVEKVKTVSEIEKASPPVKTQEVKSNVKKTEEKPEEVTAENAESIKTQYKKLDGPNFTGKKIDLKQFEKPKKKNPEVNKASTDAKKKRKRISKPVSGVGRPTANRGPGNRNSGPRNSGFKGARSTSRTPIKKRRTN